MEPSKKRYRDGHLDELAKTVEKELFAILNLHIPVEIVKHGTLPRSEGKAARIIEE